MATENLLSAQGLFKSYGPDKVIDDVSVSIHRGDRIGLVGANGSGKSTLVKMLVGQEIPDRGEVVKGRSVSLGWLAQEPYLSPTETIRDLVLGGLTQWCAAKQRYDQAVAAHDIGAQQTAMAAIEQFGGWDIQHRADAMIDQLKLPNPNRVAGDLSGGEKRRTALAQLLISEPDLAILDEPTNHLDADTAGWLETYLRDTFKGSYLLITHDRYLLDNVVTRTLEIASGKLYSYVGGWEDYLIARAEREAIEERTRANQRNYLRRELDWLSRKPKARTGKQAARIGRIEAVRDAYQDKREQSFEFSLETRRSSKTMLEFRELGLKVNDKTLVQDLDVIINPGERMGIIGPNGAGKTTLFRAIMGEVTPSSGRVVIGKQTQVSYFDQNRSGLDESKSIQWNVAGDSKKIVLGEQTLEIQTYLSRFLFDRDKQRQAVGSLSGGERARVALAKLLLLPANLILLDEPTNDLDVDALSALEEMIIEAQATALIITHDRYFLDRVATSILAFEGEGKVTRYTGNYGDYLIQRKASQREQTQANKKSAQVSVPPSVAPKAESGQKKLTYAERIELEGLMAKIEASEARVVALEAELADPNVYASRGAEVRGLMEGLEKARLEVQTLTERWESLENRAT